MSANVLVVYHGPHCHDGFTAAWVVSNFLTFYEKTNVELYPCNYGEEESKQLIDHIRSYGAYSEIYIVDFSQPMETLQDILDLSPVATTITVIDHHKTAFKMYHPSIVEPEPHDTLEISPSSRLRIYLDMNESGASLAWKYFHTGVNEFKESDEGLPILVRHVKDRDLWRFKLEGTKEIHKYLTEQEQTLEDWDRISLSLETASTKEVIVDIGRELLIEYQREVKALVATRKPCSIATLHGLMVECHGSYASDVGNDLAELSGTYGLTYSESEDGEMLNCSLRSKGYTDVELIAKTFGGGGHKNASGFRISKERAKTVLAVYDVLQENSNE